MSLQVMRAAARISLILLASFNGLAARADQPSGARPQSGGLSQVENVISGGPQDSMEVRHLILKGTNEEIGRALAQITRERYGAKVQASEDPLRTRAQRQFIEKNFPILTERMHGVASVFGRSWGDDAWNHSALGFTELKAGCSVIYLPPGRTSTSRGTVSRDYDFSTGSLTFGPLAPGLLHPTARPYLVELHPDRGYASLSMVAYDLLSGVLDGINSEGLTVTMAMDDEQFTKYPIEPTYAPSAGLGELQMSRMLLDTCGNVDEAKQALLQTKQYYQYVPVHYLIADRFGNSFIWEYSFAHNKEFIFENPDGPLVMTNFSINRHLEKGRPPSAEAAAKVCKRYGLLSEQLGAGQEKRSDDDIKQAHRKVDAELPPSADRSRPPIRTFWHALYHPAERAVQFSFYLHDEAVPGQPDQVRIARSNYQEFRLPPTELTRPPAPSETPPPAATPNADPVVKLAPEKRQVVDQIKLAGGTVRVHDDQVDIVILDRAADLEAMLPLLKNLPELDQLSIATPKMSDAGLFHLKGLKKLSVLSLRGSAVCGDGLSVVAELPQLRSLVLAGTKVTDAGLSHLATTRLEFLNLSDTSITDAGLERLASVTSLTGMNLASTQVTDAGLAHLKSMSRLTKLNLVNTRVTDDGVSKARKFLPMWIRIERSSP